MEPTVVWFSFFLVLPAHPRPVRSPPCSKLVSGSRSDVADDLAGIRPGLSTRLHSFVAGVCCCERDTSFKTLTPAPLFSCARYIAASAICREPHRKKDEHGFPGLPGLSGKGAREIERQRQRQRQRRERSAGAGLRRGERNPTEHLIFRTLSLGFTKGWGSLELCACTEAVSFALPASDFGVSLRKH